MLARRKLKANESDVMSKKAHGLSFGKDWRMKVKSYVDLPIRSYVIYLCIYIYIFKLTYLDN